jgi:hypothetical protein
MDGIRKRNYANNSKKKLCFVGKKILRKTYAGKLHILRPQKVIDGFLSTNQHIFVLHR